jgi:APA family basic amino acid/polyamine antiporter
MTDGQSPHLVRRLNTLDAVVIGLSAMLGAGVFAVFGAAASAAGPALLISLVIAGLIAYCNATSTARLAAVYPVAGGTYVYGRQRLGDFWGYLAGWSFVIGKTASCAAMALTVGYYLSPTHARLLAAVAIVGLTGLNYFGVRAAAWFSRVVVAFTLIALGVVTLAALTAPLDLARLTEHSTASPGGVLGVLQAAGLIFFAFAGYARIATLGEEIREPRRTIPRAIPIALGIALGVYAAVALAALLAVGADGLASSSAPLITATISGQLGMLSPIAAVGAALAALGSLLALILGVSRTGFAMARDGHLPRMLATVDQRRGVPRRAQPAVGAVALLLTLTVDLWAAIGFSSFGVLLYYAVTNASAWTLTDAEHRPPRWVPVLGFLGCVTLAFALPTRTVLAGVVVTAIGAAVWWWRGSSQDDMADRSTPRRPMA